MIKNVWITPGDAGFCSLTLESDSPEIEYQRIHMRELLSPETPTEKYPLRHTINLGLFTEEDIEEISETCNNYLDSQGCFDHGD